MKFKALSPNSFIIYFGDSIDKRISQKVIEIYESIVAQKFDFIIDLIPSYTSIVVIFDMFKTDFKSLKNIVQNLDVKSLQKDESTIITVDVYYGSEVGFDLDSMSKNSGLSMEEIIKIHSSEIYDIFAIGFLPAFAYMGNVPKSIATPRLKTPRKTIPKGSVAIADTQTAIYPQNSPGGWNIIGRTTFKCFDKSLPNLSPFKVGLKVKFNPICKEKFLSQGGQI